MADKFPKAPPLKIKKCPTCKEGLQWSLRDEQEGVLRVICQKGECNYSVDVFWLGSLVDSVN